MLQDVDVAVVKATTSQFHVPPKEKHVKSGRPLLTSSHSCRPGPICLTLSLVQGQAMLCVCCNAAALQIWQPTGCCQLV